MTSEGDEVLTPFDGAQLCARLEQMRQVLTWSWSELQARGGVSRATFYAWRDGQVVPSVAHVRGAAEALGVDYDEITHGLSLRRQTRRGADARTALRAPRVPSLHRHARHAALPAVEPGAVEPGAVESDAVESGAVEPVVEPGAAEPCTTAVVMQAVAGDREAERRLIAEVTPIIERSVAVRLRRSRYNRAAFQEVADLTQTVLLRLFADGGRLLLQWDPARASLACFVAMLAKHEVVSVLRNPRRSPWQEEPTEWSTLDERATGESGPESKAISHESADALAGRVSERLSPLGLTMFRLLFLDGCSVDEVCTQQGMKRDTVYAWRTRLRKLLREETASPANDTEPPPA